jgi:hypothetical protein
MSQTPYAYPPARPTSGMAIASLVLSLLGLVQVVPVLGPILGLIFGYKAMNDIRQSQGMLGGEGMAKAGIIIGWITLGLLLLSGCIALLVGVILPVLGFGGLTACSLCSVPFLQGSGNY